VRNTPEAPNKGLFDVRPLEPLKPAAAAFEFDSLLNIAQGFRAFAHEPAKLKA
jgi:hypothetical protein